ncbi:MAG: hypothetical protein PUP93_21720 [Rhizonema sp. NSF051]|nr:hypothetical protein [Rhizonema sp. NSF051]
MSKPLNCEQLKAIAMLAQGESENEVASTLSKSRSWVQQVKRHPEYQKIKDANTDAVVQAVAENTKKGASQTFSEWENRRRVQREREWQISQALLDKAQDMIEQFSLEEKRWSLKDVCSCLEISSKLARSSAQMWDEDLNAAITLVRKFGFDVVDTQRQDGCAFESVGEDEF